MASHTVPRFGILKSVYETLIPERISPQDCTELFTSPTHLQPRQHSNPGRVHKATLSHVLHEHNYFVPPYTCPAFDGVNKSGPPISCDLSQTDVDDNASDNGPNQNNFEDDRSNICAAHDSGESRRELTIIRSCSNGSTDMVRPIFFVHYLMLFVAGFNYCGDFYLVRKRLINGFVD
ncbi:unnamed protein product [Protopolystoma xenopodis]|uniref:Uncharacterized protein n=1 Tax=Protopolystoma xenopodis TaxID=117903 RepID=A0A3S5B7F2_9PLAT|nr:unnamed protein product [Protopolystoma xenopodis]